MGRFRLVETKYAEKFNTILDMVEECQSSEELIHKIRGELIKKNRPHKHKTILKIKVDNSFFYLKIRWNIGIKGIIKDLVRGTRPGCREAINYKTLKEFGFNTPSLVAYGRIKRFNAKGYSYQVTEELRQSFSIRQYLETINDKEVIDQLGKLIWLLHQKNYVFGDLNCDNVLVTRNGNTSELFFIDPIGLKKSSNKNKKFSDLVKFLFKNGEIWLDEENIDRFLISYYSCFSKQFIKTLNYKNFRKLIDEKIMNKIKSENTRNNNFLKKASAKK